MTDAPKLTFPNAAIQQYAGTNKHQTLNDSTALGDELAC
jgi:hypothetical protein